MMGLLPGPEATLMHPRHFEHTEWRTRLGHLLWYAKQTDVSFQQAELASSGHSESWSLLRIDGDDLARDAGTDREVEAWIQSDPTS